MLKMLRCCLLISGSFLITAMLFCLLYQLPFIPFGLWYGFLPCFGFLSALNYGFFGLRKGGSIYFAAMAVILLLLTAEKAQLPFTSHLKTALPIIIALPLTICGEVIGNYLNGKLKKPRITQ